MDTFTHTKGREGGKERGQERGKDKGVMGGWKAGRHWWIIQFPFEQTPSLVAGFGVPYYNPMPNAVTPILSLAHIEITSVIQSAALVLSSLGINGIPFKGFSLAFRAKNTWNMAEIQATVSQRLTKPKARICSSAVWELFLSRFFTDKPNGEN